MKKQHLPIERAENGRKAGRQVLLKLLIMIVCAATVFGLFGGCGGSGENNPTDAPAPAQTIRPTTAAVPTETPMPTRAPLVYSPDYHKTTPLMTKLVGEQAIKAARMVVDAFLKGETSVKFGFGSYEPTFAMNTVFAVNRMCPPFTAFALCNDYRDFDASTGVLKWKIINVEPNELDEKLQKFETTAIDFMSVLREGDNETERALLLYSRLTAYAQYDYEAYENPQNLTEDEYIYRTSAYSVMCDGMGICYSFAEAMTFLCAQADIDCIEVNCINDSIAHQWNLIKLDGEYYYCDATWDVGGTFNYFGMTTDERVKDSGGIKAEDMRSLSVSPEELLDGVVPSDTRFAVLREHVTSMPVTVEIDRVNDRAVFTVGNEKYSISCGN